jgi:PAS domain-containing protein
MQPTTPSKTTSLTAIAPQQQKHHRSSSASGGQDWSDDDNQDDSEYYSGDKRQLKRVANRKSAQLSRKRKKQFIEELKDENDGLRRKEQILRSIPDLVVVFDSSGKLWFVSESVSRFLDFTATELEGTSFWNRLCDDSVRLLKAAFMDSLAARENDAETASLGSGIWELRLVDKNGGHKVVTLHGVVHFAGDRPECVCSIRPHDESMSMNRSNDATVRRHESYVSASTSSAGSVTSNSSLKRHRKSSGLNSSSMLNIKETQSVVSNSVTLPSNNNNKNEQRSSSSSRGGNGSANGAVRISDFGNSSSSESGSGDELATNEIAA